MNYFVNIYLSSLCFKNYLYVMVDSEYRENVKLRIKHRNKSITFYETEFLIFVFLLFGLLTFCFLFSKYSSQRTPIV